MNVESSSSPYRSDEDARQIRLDHLESENEILVHQNEVLSAQNEALTAENRRLKIIGRELLTPAAQQTVVRPIRVQTDSELRREVAQLAARTYELKAMTVELRAQKRMMVLWMTSAVLVYTFLRMIMFV